MRATDDTREIQTAQSDCGNDIPEPDNQVRIERPFIKSHGDEEIRFGWWSRGTLVVRPLDMTQIPLAQAFAVVLDGGVFTDSAAGAVTRDTIRRFEGRHA